MNIVTRCCQKEAFLLSAVKIQHRGSFLPSTITFCSARVIIRLFVILFIYLFSQLLFLFEIKWAILIGQTPVSQHHNNFGEKPNQNPCYQANQKHTSTDHGRLCSLSIRKFCFLIQTSKMTGVVMQGRGSVLETTRFHLYHANNVILFENESRRQTNGKGC